MSDNGHPAYPSCFISWCTVVAADDEQCWFIIIQM